MKSREDAVIRENRFNAPRSISDDPPDWSGYGMAIAIAMSGRYKQSPKLFNSRSDVREIIEKGYTHWIPLPTDDSYTDADWEDEFERAYALEKSRDPKGGRGFHKSEFRIGFAWGNWTGYEQGFRDAEQGRKLKKSFEKMVNTFEQKNRVK